VTVEFHRVPGGFYQGFSKVEAGWNSRINIKIIWFTTCHIIDGYNIISNQANISQEGDYGKNQR
jgi:hypothetical protein